MEFNVFVMVAVIVIVTTIGGAYNNYLKTQRKNAEVGDREGLEAELDELRERIEVLEKIVTDQKYQLSREIDGLETPSARVREA